MKFVTDCLLSAGKMTDIKLPNLSKLCKIPSKLTITSYDDEGVESPATGIQCRIYAGSSEIIHRSEPQMRLSNEMDLAPFMGLVEKTGILKVGLANRSTDTLKLRVYTEYIPSYGGILLEEKIDHFENVLNDIHSKGFCTRIVLSFNKPLESLEFAGVASCVEGAEHWVQALKVPIDSDNDSAVYNIDLTSEGLGALYSDNLNFLELRARAKAVDSNRVFYMYVIAYGFPRGAL
jgi:hypothetical protein